MTFRLEGYDTFAGETYSLGTPLGPQGESYDGLKPSYETYGEALADARKRLASLERIHPGGRRERVLG